MKRMFRVSLTEATRVVVACYEIKRRRHEEDVSSESYQSDSSCGCACYEVKRRRHEEDVSSESDRSDSSCGCVL